MNEGSQEGRPAAGMSEKQETAASFAGRVLDKNHAPILAIDPARRITYLNRRAARLLDGSADELVGQPLERVLPAPLGRQLGNSDGLPEQGVLCCRGAEMELCIHPGSEGALVLLHEPEGCGTAAGEVLAQELADSTTVLMACLDPDFNFLWVNRAYADAADREPDFFIGRNHFKLYPHEENEAIFRRVAETGEPYSVTAKPFKHPDQPERGTTYWDWRLAPVKGPDGEVRRLLLTLMDVTEREKAQQSTRRLNSVLEAICDVNQVIVRENEPTGLMESAAEALTEARSYRGCTLALRNTDSTVISPVAGAGKHQLGRDWQVSPTGEGDAPRCVENALEERDLHKVQNTRDCGQCNFSGPHREDHHASVVAPIIADDRVMGLMHVALKDELDTEESRLLRQVAGNLGSAVAKMRAQRAVRESQERLRAAFENAPVDFWVCNRDGECILQNPQSRRTWGDQRGKRPEDMSLVGGDSAMLQESFQRALNGEVVANERELHPRGEARYYYSVVAPYRVQDEIRGVIGFNIDITQRVDAEEELRTLNEELEQRVRNRTEQLEARSQQLQELALKLTEAEAREQRRIGGILHDHLQQMLVYCKIQAASMANALDEDPSEDARDLHEVLSEAIETTRELSQELIPPLLHDRGLGPALENLADRMSNNYGITVEPDIDRKPLQIPERVRTFAYQAAQELLFNVVKHATADHARLEAERAGELLRLTVEDDGSGFDPDELEDGADASEGLGLFDLRQRADALGGTIDIDSEPGSGTRVVVRVPMQPETRAREDEPSYAAGRPADEGTAEGQYSVLVADDHAIARRGIRAMLEQESDIVIAGEAADGREAVERALELRPSVVLMDVTMPELSGVEAARRIKERAPDIRIIGLSMHDLKQTEKRMREAGADVYLAKDRTSSDLVAAIRGELHD